MSGHIDPAGELGPVGPAQRKSAFSYGMAPVATASGLALLCVGLLGFGGLSTINNTLGGEVATPSISAPATPNEGGTSTTSPTNPPERESAPEKVAPTDTVYNIVWGDTLSQISLDTGVSVKRLAEYNHIPNEDLIYADAILKIPYLLIPAQ